MPRRYPQEMRRAGSSASLSRPYLMISIGGYVIWFVYGVAMQQRAASSRMRSVERCR